MSHKEGAKELEQRGVWELKRKIKILVDRVATFDVESGNRESSSLEVEERKSNFSRAWSFLKSQDSLEF